MNVIEIIQSSNCLFPRLMNLGEYMSVSAVTGPLTCIICFCIFYMFKMFMSFGSTKFTYPVYERK